MHCMRGILYQEILHTEVKWRQKNIFDTLFGKKNFESLLEKILLTHYLEKNIFDSLFGKNIFESIF